MEIEAFMTPISFPFRPLTRVFFEELCILVVDELIFDLRCWT